ncbi:hypothetical protein [Nocardia amikacinitolerans]|uniref:hypothetical protein n=1 Tax=Nocardia amikacinitolerans TaxID=756689 RepID=UPI0020A24D1D|nr:hypothetical protein [Nocardia amikacinitolerans]
MRTDPAQTNLARTDPAQINPTRTDPAQIDPARIETARIELARIIKAQTSPQPIPWRASASCSPTHAPKSAAQPPRSWRIAALNCSWSPGAVTS